MLGRDASTELREWFAVRVRSNCELTVAQAFSARGLEYCLPLRKLRRRWSDRYKIVEFPLFPGYVFCRFHRSRRTAVLSAPGVLHVVGFGGVPAPLDPQEMAGVLAIAASGLPAEAWPYLKAGQKVMIGEGPLSGVPGIVCRATSHYRLVVNVTLLQRALSVEVESEWVCPLLEADPAAKCSGGAMVQRSFETSDLARAVGTQ
ncbi:MAG: transcription termination/antitermination protein NusG [Bryobacteraceae bacterium]